jgi:hypothetical protein
MAHIAQSANGVLADLEVVVTLAIRLGISDTLLAYHVQLVNHEARRVQSQPASCLRR